MLRQLRKNRNSGFAVNRVRTEVLDEYAEAFQKLGEADGMTLDLNRIRTVLSQYTADDIERAYDAVTRFGLMALIENM